MGTIVCSVVNRPYDSIHPKGFDQPNTEIVELIDGQQRVTVSLATALALHDYLRTRQHKLPNNNDLLGKYIVLQRNMEKELVKTLSSEAIPMAEGVDYYPRMIRGEIDTWSSKNNDFVYKSPLSFLLSSYINHIKGAQGKKPFKFDIHGMENVLGIALFKQTFGNIQKYIKELAEGTFSKDKSLILSNVEKIYDNESFLNELFLTYGMPTGIFASFRKTFTKEKELYQYKTTARVLVVSAYFLTKTMYCYTVSSNKDYSHKVFISLNTTGDTLTAYETFVPMVVNLYARPEEYSGTELQVMIREIDGYLDYNEAGQIARTLELLVNFALAEDARKLSKRHIDQQRYMLDRFEKRCGKPSECTGAACIKNAEELVKNLRNVARVREAYYGLEETKLKSCIEGDEIVEKVAGKEEKQAHKKLAREATFCLEFMADSKHTITVALISRFYSKFLKEKSVINHSELCKAIRSTAVFFALWRSSRLGTDGLGDKHRKIMEELVRKESEDPVFSSLTETYRRLLRENSKVPLTDEESQVRSELSLKEWVKLSLQIEIYTTQKHVAKFILLLSEYWKPKSSPAQEFVFSSDFWRHSAHETIEHILPQKSLKEVEVNPLLNSIGNLTLLPRNINSYINNADWENRRIIYLALCEQNENELDVKIKNITLTPEQKKLLREDWSKMKKIRGSGVSLPPIANIAKKYEVFNREKIEARGKKILEDAWEPLIEWLGGKTYQKEKSEIDREDEQARESKDS